MLISKQREKCNKLSQNKILTSEKLADLDIKLLNRGGQKSNDTTTAIQKIFIVSEYTYMETHYLHSSLQNLETEKSKKLQINYLS